MGATAEALTKAASAYPDLRRYLPGGRDLPDVRTLEDFTGALERAERAAQSAYDKLVRMADAGLDLREDYAIYSQLQNAIYKAQLSAIELVIRVVNSATVGGGELIRPLLTPPRPFPSMTWSGRHESQAGLRGLGNPLVIAGVIATALAALGLMYLYAEEIGDMVDDLTAVYIAHARAAQQSELLAARRDAFNACLARGGNAEDCRAEVLELVPTPAEAGTDIPDAPGSRREPWTWGQIGLAVAGGVVVVSVVGGLFVVARERLRYGFGGYSNVPVSRVPALPARVANLHGPSAYNLEVRRGR